MIPTFMVLAVGSGRRIYIPLPVFLVWPFLAVGALVLAVCTPFAPASSRAGRRFRAGWQALRAFGQLRGLKIDVESNDGSNVFISFV